MEFPLEEAVGLGGLLSTGFEYILVCVACVETDLE
jgi:hypothetical protein